MGRTPLHFSSFRGNSTVCSMLLRHDADIEAQDRVSFRLFFMRSFKSTNREGKLRWIWQCRKVTRILLRCSKVVPLLSFFSIGIFHSFFRFQRKWPRGRLGPEGCIQDVMIVNNIFFGRKGSLCIYIYCMASYHLLAVHSPPASFGDDWWLAIMGQSSPSLVFFVFMSEKREEKWMGVIPPTPCF